jgi:hypothetical protein
MIQTLVAVANLVVVDTVAAPPVVERVLVAVASMPPMKEIPIQDYEKLDQTCLEDVSKTHHQPQIPQTSHAAPGIVVESERLDRHRAVHTAAERKPNHHLIDGAGCVVTELAREMEEVVLPHQVDTDARDDRVSLKRNQGMMGMDWDDDGVMEEGHLGLSLEVRGVLVDLVGLPGFVGQCHVPLGDRDPKWQGSCLLENEHTLSHLLRIKEAAVKDHCVR